MKGLYPGQDTGQQILAMKVMYAAEQQKGTGCHEGAVLWAGQKGTDLDHDSDVVCRATERNGGIGKDLYPGLDSGEQTFMMNSAAQQR